MTMTPGLTELTRMLNGARSTAAQRESISVAAYVRETKERRRITLVVVIEATSESEERRGE